MMKKVYMALVTCVLAGVIAIAAPSQAHAIGSLNPLCWIADQRNPAVKENCKGHDWRWPHWGGRGNSDGPDRGCGGGNIYSDAWWMNSQELREFNYGQLRSVKGIRRGELILTSVTRYRVQFARDYIIYTWKSQTASWVDYGYGSYMQYFTDIKVETVKCDLNNHRK